MALNTGHDGSLTTCHSNSPEDTLHRIEAMVLMGAPAWPPSAVQDHVRRSIDVIVHLGRGHDGRRTVTEVVEVCAERATGRRALAVGSAVVGAPSRRRERS